MAGSGTSMRASVRLCQGGQSGEPANGQPPPLRPTPGGGAGRWPRGWQLAPRRGLEHLRPGVCWVRRAPACGDAPVCPSSVRNVQWRCGRPQMRRQTHCLPNWLRPWEPEPNWRRGVVLLERGGSSTRSSPCRSKPVCCGRITVGGDEGKET